MHTAICVTITNLGAGPPGSVVPHRATVVPPADASESMTAPSASEATEVTFRITPPNSASTCCTACATSCEPRFLIDPLTPFDGLAGLLAAAGHQLHHHSRRAVRSPCCTTTHIDWRIITPPSVRRPAYRSRRMSSSCRHSLRRIGRNFAQRSSQRSFTRP
jgi:hypothetical protein